MISIVINYIFYFVQLFSAQLVQYDEENTDLKGFRSCDIKKEVARSNKLVRVIILKCYVFIYIR